MTFKIVLTVCLFLLIKPVLAAEDDIKMIRDLAYGNSPLQTMDVYLPANAKDAPILLLIHGGAWQFGDKRSTGLIKNKVNRWVKKGFILVSTNYRLVPEVDPITQAKDIAAAIHTIQTQAEQWQGDADKMMVLGHSAGAHLLALLTSHETLMQEANIRPWLASFVIDSQVLDLVALMHQKHVEFYDKAFGKQEGYWQQASPINYVNGNEIPMFVVCSLQREYACDSSARFVNTLHQIGSQAKLLQLDLTHDETLEDIGLNNIYTQTIENYMSDLHPQIKNRLMHSDKKNPPTP